MPWSSFFKRWVLSHFFTLLFHLHQESLKFLFTFCHKGGVICISKVMIFLLVILILASASPSLAFHMMYSEYKLNNQGDNIQPWHTPFPILNHQLSSVTQSCPTLCDPMNCSMPGLPVHHQLPESTETHVHWVSDAIQPSHPLSSPSPALSLSQQQGLFKWVSSLHQMAKVLEFQLQNQSFHWTPRTDFL